MSKSFLVSQSAGQPTYHQPSIAEERELWQRIQGDLHQFQQLIELYYRRIFQHAYLHLADEQAAEQVCRFTFLQALDIFDTYVFSPAMPLSKWLYEQFRQMMVLRHPDVEAPKNSAPSVAHSHTLSNRDVRRLAIDAYLRGLSFDERELLILRIYESLPWERIAELLPGDAEAARLTYDSLASQFEPDIQRVLDRIAGTHSALMA